MVVSHFLKIEFPNCTKVINEKHQRVLPFAESPLFNASIHDSKLLTRGENINKVYDLTLDIQDVDFQFQPGDTIGILPSNDHQEIEEILQFLNLKDTADKLYKISIKKDTSKKNPKIPLHVPEYGTLRNLLECHIDIRSPPKKVFLQALANYAQNESEKSNLLHLCSKEGSEDYMKFINEHLGLLDILKRFPSCLPPIELILEYLPPLQPRPYSISSSPLIKNLLHITFSVVDLGNGKKGVCTGWLENLIKEKESKKGNIEDVLRTLDVSDAVNRSISFYFRKPKIRPPKDPLTPIIMVGPGTGVAPFIGFLQDRLLNKERGVVYGSSWLFFGCRYSDRDFIFKNEMKEFLDGKILGKLFVCFSRENEKKYVQDLISENGEQFTKMICENNAVVYICGDEKNMMKCVKNAVISCLMKHRGIDLDAATAYVNNLQKNCKYMEDSWL